MFEKGFGVPLVQCKLSDRNQEISSTSNNRQFMTLLKDHVEEALAYGFDDSLTKYKGKSHFVVRI